MDDVCAESRTGGAPSAHAPPTSHGPRIRYLDGWRGLSIAFVLVGHFLLDRIQWLGPLGVELFFVLSGRLMADILFVERLPLAEFYKRRLSRIYPALLVFVLVTWAWTQGTELEFKTPAAVAALTFTINYAMVLKHFVAALDHLWSLCIEEHAYLLLGTLAFLARGRKIEPVRALLALAAFSIADAAVSSIFLRQDYYTVYWRTDAHLASIFLACAAYLLLRNRPTPSLTPLLAFAGAFAVMLIGPDVVRFSLGTGLLAVAVATLDRAPTAVKRLLSSRAVTSAGIWSYSVYLWQQPFFKLERAGHLPDYVAIGLSATCGLGSFYLVEQPARRWINANWRLSVRRPLIAPETAG